DADRVYITFKDLYNNQTQIYKDVLAAPEAVQIKDASNVIKGDYRLVVLWHHTTGYDHYNLWRCTNLNPNYTQIDSTSKNAYVDNDLDQTVTYTYRVMTEDATGNISPPTNEVLARPGSAPDVTQNPQVELYGWKQENGVRAKITWNTDQLSDSYIIYAKEELETGSSTKTKSGADALIAGAVSMVTEHEVWLSNLEPQTKYWFKALSKNEIQIAGYSGVLDFVTPERIPLLISGMKMSDITMTGALVDWETSKAATTVLEYGPTTSYGSTLTDANFNIDHTFKLENLDSGVEYNLRAKVTDSDGNTTISDNYTFSTPAMPIISGIAVSQTTFDSATVSWTTNVNTDSNVQYDGPGGTEAASTAQASTTSSSQTPTKSGSGMQGKPDSTTVHSVTLIGLEAKTSYSFKAISKDKFGNTATSANSSFTTLSDTQAPKVSNVQAEVSSIGSAENIKYQAVISWETDEPSTSQIKYSAGISGDFSETTKEDLSLNSTHVVIIPDLKPNSAYHFMIESKDRAGNAGVSEDTSLITPPKEKSLLSVILRSLEDTFSWVGRLREKWLKN
ncbi:MAG: fibronectin type III domain-containing protein, partial [Patescibacteria group bacterium]